MRLLLLGTPACHLCDQAELLLNEYGYQSQPAIAIEYVDIAEQQQWQNKYESLIPVLYHPGTQQELRWPFTLDDIQKFLSCL